MDSRTLARLQREIELDFEYSPPETDEQRVQHEEIDAAFAVIGVVINTILEEDERPFGRITDELKRLALWLLSTHEVMVVDHLVLARMLLNRWINDGRTGTGRLGFDLHMKIAQMNANRALADRRKMAKRNDVPRVVGSVDEPASTPVEPEPAPDGVSA
jgi:hypothetical protein